MYIGVLKTVVEMKLRRYKIALTGRAFDSLQGVTVGVRYLRFTKFPLGNLAKITNIFIGIFLGLNLKSILRPPEVGSGNQM